jgi:hypothetical protein
LRGTINSATGCASAAAPPDTHVDPQEYCGP